jgi:hypothetical protein
MKHIFFMHATFFFRFASMGLARKCNVSYPFSPKYYVGLEPLRMHIVHSS